MNKYIPFEFKQTPLAQYQKRIGYYFRYFYKKSNYPYSEPFEMTPIENRLVSDNPAYDVLRIKWCTRGKREDVSNLNKSILEHASTIFKGMIEKFSYDLLINYDEFSEYKFDGKLEMKNSHINIIIKEDPVNLYIGQIPNSIFLDIKNTNLSTDTKLQRIIEYISKNETTYTHTKITSKKDVVSIVYDDLYNVFLLTKYGLQIYSKNILV